MRPAIDRGLVHFLSGGVLRTYDANAFVQLGPPFTVPGAGSVAAGLIRVGDAGLAFSSNGRVFFLDVPTTAPPPPPLPPTSRVAVTLSLGGCTACTAGSTLIVSGMVSNL